MKYLSFIRQLLSPILYHLKYFLLATALTFSSAAFADLSTLMAANNEMGIQVVTTQFNYTETGYGLGGINTGPLDTEDGKLPGYAAFLSSMSEEGYEYFAAEFSKSTGDTSFTGALKSDSYGSVVNSSSSAQTNFYVRLGKGFPSDTEDSNAMATLYFELGNHKWERGLGGSVPYQQTYTDGYLVFGGRGQFAPEGSKLVLSASAAWGVTFNPNITSTLETVGTRGNPPTTLCEFAADYELENHLHGNFGVDIASYSYVISTTYMVNGNKVFAPDTNIIYTTVKLGLGYSF